MATAKTVKKAEKAKAAKAAKVGTKETAEEVVQNGGAVAETVTKKSHVEAEQAGARDNEEARKAVELHAQAIKQVMENAKHDNFDTSREVTFAHGDTLTPWGRTNSFRMKLFPNLVDTNKGETLSVLIRVGVFIDRGVEMIEVDDGKGGKKTVPSMIEVDDGKGGKRMIPKEIIKNRIDPKDLPADMDPALKALDIVWLRTDWRRTDRNPDFRVGIHISNWLDAAAGGTPRGDTYHGPRVIQGCGMQSIGKVEGGREVKTATVAVIVQSGELYGQTKIKNMRRDPRGRDHLDRIRPIGIVIEPDPVTGFDPFTLFEKVWFECGQGEEERKAFTDIYGVEVTRRGDERETAASEDHGTSESTINSLLSNTPSRGVDRRTLATIADGVRHSAGRRRGRGDRETE